MKTSRLAVAVIVLAGGWLGATAYTKHSVDQAYRDQIAKLEKRLPMLHVSGLKQEGGMFSGSYSGTLNLGCAPVGGKPHPKSLAIAFEDKVQYGPLPGFTSFGAARLDSHFALTESAPAEIRASLAKLAPAQIRTEIGYGGGTKASMVLPAGELSFGSGAGQTQLHWAETRLQATATRDAAQLQYDWSLPELGFSANGPEGSGSMKMLLKNMVAKGESTGRPDSWLREGKEQSSVERMEFTMTVPQQPPMTFIYDHMTARTVSQLKQEFMDVSVGWGMAGLEMQGAGQNVKLANFVMDSKFQHLDTASIEKMVTAFLSGFDKGCAVLEEEAKTAEPKDPRALFESMFKGVDEAGQAMMAHDPAFSIDKLAFDFNGKRGEMSLSAKLQGLDTTAMAGPEAQQAWAKAGQLEARARIPLAWLALAAGGDAQKAQETADGFVAMGFAKRDGDFLTAEFSFAQGVAKLNGAVFPPQRAQPQ